MEPTPIPAKPNDGRRLFAATILSAIAVTAVAVQTVAVVQIRCHEQAYDRDDLRAMWIELFDLFPESEEGQLLRRTLDERLPRLECVGLIPHTVRAEQ